MEWIIYLTLGVLAGFFAGLLGVGGGVVIVPVLFFVFKFYLNISSHLIMHMAVGTSLAVIMMNAGISAVSHYRKRNLLLPIFLKMLFGLMCGAGCAALIANFVSGKILQMMFIVFLTAAGIQALCAFKPKHSRMGASIWRANFAGFVISFFASLLGIGGGIMSTPYFLWQGIPMRQSVALASACGFPLSLVAAIGFMLAGRVEVGLPPFSIGYVYVPAVIGIAFGAIFASPLGVKVALKLPNKPLRLVFFVFVMLMALSMLADFL